MCNADQFVEVVQPGEILRVAGRLQFAAVAGTVEDRLDQIAQFVIKASAQFVEQFDESGDRFLRPGVQHRHLTLGGGDQRIGERASGALGVDGHAGLGAVPDTAAGGVEDAPQADRITRIVQHPQVGDDVANLLALVEPNPADHLVRDAGADEHLLQCP